ncbi:CidA/LrgA family protein [Clostridium algidicarnis]|uniref:CidA/LrgA family protein n=1 Tax=Clostridium algidicarnis TaxID=37659 RepID=UPI0016237AE2|nr:CidA/LrgA family protein [Clostridium algidicarnis]MBB6631581.1 CidA/LrgA family protein [Clostridium algidicarnis]MBB6697990.1 CidA/LrgA family protein [Clostridium algidicarnis]MBU3195137.1 CidA/LrgA family protein [Clostridium algidicarnis]MBU3203676.1 CidA/LrgA family protein [Clostridium algidicarnis]MBU3206040.1 CidA/LrgA family protein [Clostridium algidicarnis]
MKILKELMIILSFYLLGELIHNIFKVPVPGNIIAMIILLLSLMFNIIKLEQINNVSKFFLDNLAFFFIPAGVGLITSISLLKDNFHKILFVCFISTIIVMLVSAKTTSFLINRKRKRGI